MSILRVAVAQCRSTPDYNQNLESIQKFVLEAEALGADLICFPENALYRGPKESGEFSRKDTWLRFSEGHLLSGTPFASKLSKILNASKIAISLGSVLERLDEDAKPANTHLFVFPKGRVVSYQKIHLFNFSSSAGVYRESDEIHAGQSPVVVDFKGFKIGLSVCYDLRFPELYRAMTLNMGAELLLIPAAFTRVTGEAHWHTLLRARAIENLSFVVASGQWGAHLDSRGQELFCYGHSLVVGPWGQILSEAPQDGDSLQIVELNKEEALTKRNSLPCLQSASFFQSMSSDSE